MSEINIYNRPLIFKELPKEQRKALQKEYSTTAEAKKMSIVFTVAVLTYIVIGFVSGIIIVLTMNFAFWIIPCMAVFICLLLPAALSRSKFEKWLTSEKNIVMK